MTGDDLKKLMEGYLPAEPKDQPVQKKNQNLGKEEPAVQRAISRSIPDVSREELIRMMAETEPEPKEADRTIPVSFRKKSVLPVLDLHLLTVEGAREEFIRFMETCLVQDDPEKALVITGKGLGSDRFQARIKPMIEKELNGTYKKRIDRWQTAPPDMGGSGAILIWFR